MLPVDIELTDVLGSMEAASIEGGRLDLARAFQYFPEPCFISSTEGRLDVEFLRSPSPWCRRCNDRCETITGATRSTPDGAPPDMSLGTSRSGRPTNSPIKDTGRRC